MVLNLTVKLSGQKSKLSGEILTKETQLRDIYEQIKDAEDNRAEKVEEAQIEYLAAERLKIDEKYSEEVTALEKEIAEINEYIKSVVIEDDHHELSEVMQKKETLNKASIKITEFYNQLLKASQKEFIDLAITEDILPYKKFRKHIKNLDSYILHLTNIEKLYTLIEANPEMVVTNLVSNENRKISDDDEDDAPEVKNITYYIRGVWLGPIQVVTFPIKLIKAVRRVHILHKYSKLYHMLIQTVFQVQEENNSLIQEIFQNLLDDVRNSKLDTRKEKEAELDKLLSVNEREKKEIFFSTDDIEETINKTLYQLKKKHEELEETIAKMRAELDVIDQKLRSNYERIMTEAQKEREQFMNPRNEVRHVILPTNLIWEVREATNGYFPVLPGLYTYTSRETTTKFLRLLTFQLRNYMKWGTLKIHILDVMRASWTNRFLLPDESTTDILLTPMSEDFDETISVIHDALDRKLKAILSSFTNIAEYNTVQEELGSEPIPYEFVIQFLEHDQKFNDKIIQLFVAGEQVGVIPMLFIKREDITPAAIKIYEKYVDNVIELTQTGLTTLTSSIFRQNFEKELEEKQGRLKGQPTLQQ